MKRDHDWDALAEDFKAGGAETDVGALVARASRDNWIHRAKLAVELLGYAGSIVLFGVLSSRVTGVWPFAAFVSASFVAAMAYTMNVRRGMWAAAAAGEVTSFVELSCRRKRADVLVARLGGMLLLILSLGLAVWLPYFVATTRDPMAGTWLAVPTRLGFAVVTLLGTAFYLRYKLARERAALAKLEAIRKSLAEESGDSPSAPVGSCSSISPRD